ncbi:MAG: hypothetical protein P1P76_06710 [Anaerolineales bacterium]|nr:hypothetical protein [Anaerolineales bacterium]
MNHLLSSHVLRLLPGVLLIALLSGCGQAPVSIDEPANEPAEIADDDAEEISGSEAEFLIDEGMDLSGIDVCTMLPLKQVAAIAGPLDQETPREMISIDREVDCQHYNTSGEFFEVQLYPLDQWALQEIILNDVQAMEGIGDDAFLGTYSDAITLRTLVEGTTVISTRVSNMDLNTAIALYELTLESLP